MKKEYVNGCGSTITTITKFEINEKNIDLMEFEKLKKIMYNYIKRYRLRENDGKSIKCK